MRFCTHCGQELVREDARFCASCGQPVRTVEEAARASQEAVAAPPPPAAPIPTAPEQTPPVQAQAAQAAAPVSAPPPAEAAPVPPPPPIPQASSAGGSPVPPVPVPPSADAPSAEAAPIPPAPEPPREYVQAAPVPAPIPAEGSPVPPAPESPSDYAQAAPIPAEGSPVPPAPESPSSYVQAAPTPAEASPIPPAPAPQSAYSPIPPAPAPGAPELAPAPTPAPRKRRGRGLIVVLVIVLILAAGGGAAYWFLYANRGGDNLVEALEQAVAARDIDLLRELVVPEEEFALTDDELLDLGVLLVEGDLWPYVQAHLEDRLAGGKGDAPLSALDPADGVLYLRPVQLRVTANVADYELEIDSSNARIEPSGDATLITLLPGRHTLTGTIPVDYSALKADASADVYLDSETTTELQLFFPVFEVELLCDEGEVTGVFIDGRHTDLMPENGRLRIPYAQEGMSVLVQARRGVTLVESEIVIGAETDDYIFDFGPDERELNEILGMSWEDVDQDVVQALLEYYLSYVEAINEQDLLAIERVTPDCAREVEEWVLQNADYEFQFVALAVDMDSLDYYKDRTRWFTLAVVRFDYAYRAKGSSGAWTPMSSMQICELLIEPDGEAIWLISYIDLDDSLELGDNVDTYSME